MSQPPRKLLILYIDRDNDIGRATGLKTPIIGREANLSAGTNFAIQTPEDSDVNSLFAAIRTYDKIKEEEKEVQCEIATLAGDASGGYRADTKLAAELRETLSVFPATGAVLISDGPEDEKALPVIQSNLPVISVRRVIVQQQRSVEETYALLTRYLRRLSDEPRLAKIFLGVPGILALIFVAMILAGVSQYGLDAALAIIGFVLVIRGFSVDRLLRSLWQTSPIKLVTATVAVITILTATYIAGISASTHVSQGPLVMASQFIKDALDLTTIGLATFFGGRFIHGYVAKEEDFWHGAVGVVFVVSMHLFFQQLSGVLITQELSNLILGVVVPVAATLTVIGIFTVGQRVRNRLDKVKES